MALGIQHAVRVRRILLTTVACLALCRIYTHYLMIGTFCGRKLLSIKRVFWFVYNFGPKHFSFEEERIIQRDINPYPTNVENRVSS